MPTCAYTNAGGFIGTGAGCEAYDWEALALVAQRAYSILSADNAPNSQMHSFGNG